MIFVVDTNVVFAGLLRDSITRELLIDSPFILYAPETMIKEIRKYEDIIIQRSELSKEDFEILFGLLINNINIVEKEKYSEKLEEADKFIGHIDKGDVPFLALALNIPNNGIWTENKKHFESQNRIKIWTTDEILKTFW